MTESEQFAEWQYRYEERLGMLCGDSEPDATAKAIARAEADSAMAELWAQCD